MNKILVNKNKIDNYKDDKIVISDGNICFYKDGIYELEYRECDQVKLNFMIDKCNIKILESSFDNDIVIDNKYDIDGGSLVTNRFSNDKKVESKIDFNLLHEGDRVDYNFANICLGEEEYTININHREKKTVSYINNRTVALKNSKTNFIINSVVLKDSIKSILDQNTRIVTMGECDTKIEPNMFIDLDDVEARHGSVIGTFKDDQVFYLMSKGISYNDTLKLLIKGYLLSKIEVSVDVRIKMMDIIERYWR